MSDPYLYTYPSPLEGWAGSEPLSDEKVAEGPDAKSLINPKPTKRSEAYTSFAAPITNGTRGGFDIHIYFLQSDAYETQFATELHERVRREFPELRTYKLWHEAIGPHALGMFEVNVFNPEQFGAFVAWLVVNRGPLSALVHPNTGDDLRDHTQRATWLGQPLPVYTKMLREIMEKKAKENVNGS